MKSRLNSWLFFMEVDMIKRILRELAKLENNKLKLVEEQAKTQKQIDDVDVKIKEWNILKKEYEKIEKKFNNYINPKGTNIYGGEIAVGTYYNGATLSGINKKYATDKNWANSVYKHMQYLYNKL